MFEIKPLPTLILSIIAFFLFAFCVMPFLCGSGWWGVDAARNAEVSWIGCHQEGFIPFTKTYCIDKTDRKRMQTEIIEYYQAKYGKTYDKFALK